MPTVAEMIEALCARGHAPEQIAAALDVTVQAVSSWRSGRVKKPRSDTLEGILRLYATIEGGTSAGGEPHGTRPIEPAADDQGPAAVRRTGAGGIPDEEEAAPLPERHATPPPRTPGEAFRFIHCADLHVDSPLAGIRRIDPRQAPWITLATRRAFTRLVDMAIGDRVDFVVIAGDLFDGEWKSADTGIFVSRQLARLTAASIPVFAIAGNHDAASVVTRFVRWPEGARLLRDTAESVELPGLGVVIHGRSFGDRHVAADFVEAYPPARPGFFNLGILHTSLGGDSGHATYAPCTPAQLATRGYDYWALGHVHVPRVVQTSPHIVYSGNIQGRDIGETGPRGCQVVTVDAARRPSVHFVPLDDVRWERIEVAVDRLDAVTVDDVVAAVADRLEARLPEEGRLLACRIVLTGATDLHGRLVSRRGSLRDDIAAVAASQFEGRICLEQVDVRTTAPTAVAPLPPRLVGLLEEEFERLRSMPADALLAEQADLRALFDALGALDAVRPGTRDGLQGAEAWRSVVGEARDVLDAEIDEAVGRGEADA